MLAPWTLLSGIEYIETKKDTLKLGCVNYSPYSMYAFSLCLGFSRYYHGSLVDIYDVFTHIFQDYFTGTGAIICLPHCLWSMVKCRYKAVRYNMIFHTPLHWLMQNINLTSDSQQTLHSLPSRASYGVSVVSNLKKIDSVIMALHCDAKGIGKTVL